MNLMSNVNPLKDHATNNQDHLIPKSFQDYKLLKQVI